MAKGRKIGNRKGSRFTRECIRRNKEAKGRFCTRGTESENRKGEIPPGHGDAKLSPEKQGKG